MSQKYQKPQPHSQQQTRIADVQGNAMTSPYDGKEVTLKGVVTGFTRKGYFIQDPEPQLREGVSDAIFVYSTKRKAPKDALVEVKGKVVDYEKEGSFRVITQIQVFSFRVIQARGPSIEPIILGRDFVLMDSAAQAKKLNGLESMLVKIEAGAKFIAPSNPFGDYVVLPKESGDTDSDESIDLVRSESGGVLIDLNDPDRWFPNFRNRNYDMTPPVNVGATLSESVSGPLNYRVGSFQVVVDEPIKVQQQSIELEEMRSDINPERLYVMTMNGFNLDVKIERPELVQNPHRDIDDDLGDGRFIGLAKAIIEQARRPDIVALQEIQDNDGAELTEVVDASATYQTLIDAVIKLGGPTYDWVDLPPMSEKDGGQPGGNIRNGFLFNPQRVSHLAEHIQRIGESLPAFEDSRKPLVARFKHNSNGAELTIVNVHLASKRHQVSMFAHTNPGVDPREPMRVLQAEAIVSYLDALDNNGDSYYVTGDFNDLENSRTLQTLVGETRENMVWRIPNEGRYDYNHRGKLQVLMHGVVPKRLSENDKVRYWILHGNDLIGVRAGELGSKPTDHAYVMAEIAP